MRTCVREGCDGLFSPTHKGHICCSSGCWTAILHGEIGQTASGMRPFGFFGDRVKIQAVRRKYEQKAKDMHKLAKVK